MKYPVFVSIIVLFTCGCNLVDGRTKLLSEQKVLKDNAYKLGKRLGDCSRDDVYDGEEKKQFKKIQNRLIDIQHSIDSLDKMK